MSWRKLLLFALGVALGSGTRAENTSAPLILISLDGFRWDYTDLHPAESPRLRALKREGVAARGLVPVFPSNTFPNHYSIVTGLYPAHHGIINNSFFDPVLGAVFQFNVRTSVSDSRWWGGEPIWVTAVKQDRKAATSFWVGSEAEIAGIRPTHWHTYDYSIPFEKRLEELVGWLKRPAPERPALVAFYLEETNAAGHMYGPDSPQVTAAIKLLDDRIATMLARLQSEKIEANVVVVSDHGMASTSRDRIIILDDYIDRTSVQVEADGSALALRPIKSDADAVIRALAVAPHVKTYRAEDLPAHFHLTDNARIAPVWALPEEGWHLVLRSTFERLRVRFPVNGYLQGDHGYDPRSPNMRGIFIAHGPAFKRGVEIPEVENIHVYNLLCAVLRLVPAKNDGDDRLVKAALRE